MRQTSVVQDSCTDFITGSECNVLIKQWQINIPVVSLEPCQFISASPLLQKPYKQSLATYQLGNQFFKHSQLE